MICSALCVIQRERQSGDCLFGLWLGAERVDEVILGLARWSYEFRLGHLFKATNFV